MKRLFACFVLFVCLACSTRTDLAGRYEARHPRDGGTVEVIMVLGGDGSGKWEIEGEALPFSWTVRQDMLNVHTRDGAVVVGAAEGGNVRLDVPGVGKLLFVRGK